MANDELAQQWRGSPMSAEILEQSAGGNTLRLYERLKAAMPAQTVNLVYRRLATYPGALPWVVSLVEELAAESLLPRVAGQLTSTPVPTVSPVPPANWENSGVSRSELELGARILSVYNWSNPRNVLVLQFMRKGLEAGAYKGVSAYGPKLEKSGPSGQPAANGDSLEPPLPPEKLAPDVLARAKELCAALDVDPGLLPTLHRHLGGMPVLYRGLVSMTAELVSNGQVKAATVRWQDTAAALVDAECFVPEEAPEEAKEGINHVIGQFRSVIPTHCVLGLMWQRLLGVEQSG